MEQAVREAGDGMDGFRNQQETRPGGCACPVPRLTVTPRAGWGRAAPRPAMAGRRHATQPAPPQRHCEGGRHSEALKRGPYTRGPKSRPAPYTRNLHDEGRDRGNGGTRGCTHYPGGLMARGGGCR
ncbi:hypothetical protein GWK47_035098 [Chionoecetes opilio]|uniref:Uncharacterized protein n=1 Tax=Chionoecetes opilio TaxID=41210 RepID=A0A8J4YNG8_CHIOP|nr:hypothetical protein GWK47_035098 [Chionoecetes opilio]